MPEVIALSAFEHNGSRRRNERFEVSDTHARALERAGLVEIIGAADDPGKAAGAPLSASPAAQASQQTTASESEPGVKRRWRKPKNAE